MKRLRDRSPRVLVVGDLMLDHYVQGASDRVSPEAPVLVVDVQQESTSLGGAGNVLKNLLALGARVAAGAVLGDDATGREVHAGLAEAGVDTSAVLARPGRESSRKTRVVVGNQQVVRFDRETKTPIPAACETELIARLQEQLAGCEAVVLSDYHKGVLTPRVCQAVIQAARRRSVPVLVDPKGHDYAKYRGATLVTPNRKEAQQATGIAIIDDASLEAAARRLREDLALDYAVITLSEQGLAVYADGLTRMRAVAKEVFDVSGAGDTVIATLAFSLACGVSIHEAAELANQAAGVVVGKFGSATATWDEILGDETAATLRLNTLGVKTADEMATIAAELRRGGRRIVFTNGCFDLLHRGHVEYLSESRSYGDLLIVGLNSDASVQRLKGPGRPVTNEADRAEILTALRAVDYVVLFDEDTPYELIRRLRPHVLTKGADYRPEDVVGADLVDELRLIPFREGRSTTRTISAIRRAA